MGSSFVGLGMDATVDYFEVPTRRARVTRDGGTGRGEGEREREREREGGREGGREKEGERREREGKRNIELNENSFTN